MNKTIDKLFTNHLHVCALAASGNRVAYHKLMAFAHNKNKTVLELDEAKISKNPTAESNKALSSWNKKPMPENQEIRLSPNFIHFPDKEYTTKNTTETWQALN